MHQRGFAPILVLIVGAVIVIAVYFAFNLIRNPSFFECNFLCPTPSSIPQPPTSEYKLPLLSKTDNEEIKNWQLYTNVHLGFQMRIPPEWTKEALVTKPPNSGGFYIEGPNCLETKGQCGSISVMTYDLDETQKNISAKDYWSYYNSRYGRKYIEGVENINNQEVYIVVFNFVNFTLDGQEVIKSTHKDFVFFKNNKVYELRYTEYLRNGKPKVLDSVPFTDWKHVETFDQVAFTYTALNQDGWRDDIKVSMGSESGITRLDILLDRSYTFTPKSLKLINLQNKSTSQIMPLSEFTSEENRIFICPDRSSDPYSRIYFAEVSTASLKNLTSDIDSILFELYVTEEDGRERKILLNPEAFICGFNSIF
ncbi:MAG: hypothetical protein UV59_C0012G0061 [Candidatus Gottesmanbacteria bacterium GW2011_GWA1_43_11]|uniref:Uncharacterized protein n=1 Tax=Candidatus Gottesmanbacteria bacterium GW2011_GWA1_43_11 TaxID=1618436 RepID=A0A0G1FDN8_9BACT|nr:MAG: hypothetical protein UV59_C0012G0061 [Candidatus Gottesmanbacteria bacterium GW2011_GWA1_43_11]